MAKILIVEDNELNMKLFYDLLTIQGHDILVSRDGSGVIQTAENEKLDLILMDIHLNGISGIDLIQELKSGDITKHIPIIVITAFAMKQDELRISASGCDMYLTKPVSIDGFLATINKFLNLNNKPVD